MTYTPEIMSDEVHLKYMQSSEVSFWCNITMKYIFWFKILTMILFHFESAPEH